VVDATRQATEVGPARASFAVLVLGALSGVAAKVADESRVSWLSDLGTYPAVWVAALAVVARLSPSARTAALRATGFFTIMCAAYYAWSTYILGFGGSARLLVLWAAVALFVVPPLAAAVQWAFAHRGLLPGLVVAVVAATPLTDGTVWQMWWAYVLRAAPENFPLRPVQALVSVAVAVSIAGLLPRHTGTRLWAAALLVPVAVTTNAVVTPLLAQFLAF
jgi:hypothetical protein